MTNSKGSSVISAEAGKRATESEREEENGSLSGSNPTTNASEG